MPCYLSFYGTHFDVDKFVRVLGIKNGSISRRGEVSGKHARCLVRTIYTVSVSEADFDQLDQQIRDAISFLSENFDGLSGWKEYGVDLPAYLDFGFEARLRRVAVQVDCLPSELLSLVGKLGFDILMSQYAPAIDRSE